jgi:preprotein translocase subunit Sec61beta
MSLLLLSASAGAQESPSTARPVDANPGYVEYGNIRFRDEKAMLDHYASQLRLDPDSVVYIFAFSGRVACAGEAKARAVRAKNYLVKKHSIAPDRVIWKDGGLRENLSVELWLRPRAKPAPEPTLTVNAAYAAPKDCGHKKRGRLSRLAGRA